MIKIDEFENIRCPCCQKIRRIVLSISVCSHHHISDSICMCIQCARRSCSKLSKHLRKVPKNES